MIQHSLERREESKQTNKQNEHAVCVIDKHESDQRERVRGLKVSVNCEGEKTPFSSYLTGLLGGFPTATMWAISPANFPKSGIPGELGWNLNSN